MEDSHQNALVIEGTITNAEPPYTIKLCISSNVESPEYIALSGYRVSISDDHGKEEILSEPWPDTYVTSSIGMQGVVGRKYKLILQSPQGKTYALDFETMKEPVGIQSVYTEVEYERSQTPPSDIPGYRFYIDTETAQSASTFLSWFLDETYKYEFDYLIYFYYKGILHPVINRDTPKTCSNSSKIYPFIVHSALVSSEPRFTHFPLHFVNTLNPRENNYWPE